MSRLFLHIHAEINRTDSDICMDEIAGEVLTVLDEAWAAVQSEASPYYH